MVSAICCATVEMTSSILMGLLRERNWKTILHALSGIDLVRGHFAMKFIPSNCILRWWFGMICAACSVVTTGGWENFTPVIEKRTKFWGLIPFSIAKGWGTEPTCSPPWVRRFNWSSTCNTTVCTGKGVMPSGESTGYRLQLASFHFNTRGVSPHQYVPALL